MKPTLVAAFGASILAAAAPTFGDETTGKALHDEGLSMLSAGRVDEACSKLGASAEAHRAAQVLADLARCHELQGRIATAYAEHVEASNLADAAGDADRALREREAASRLAPRLSKLRVEIVESQPGLVVKRDGVVLKPEQLGALLVVDPGLHVVTAEAPGFEPFRAEIRIGADADAKGVLVPRLTKKKKATPSGPVSDGMPTLPPSDDDGRRGRSPVGIVGFVASGVGFIGVVMGTIFGIQTLVEVSEAEDDERLCPEKKCTKLGRLAIDEAETKGIVSTVSFSVGGVALATGVTLLLVDLFVLSEPGQKADEKPVGLVPWVGPEGGGLGVSVSF
jgi:hypothetical protein